MIMSALINGENRSDEFPFLPLFSINEMLLLAVHTSRQAFTKKVKS